MLCSGFQYKSYILLKDALIFFKKILREIASNSFYHCVLEKMIFTSFSSMASSGSLTVLGPDNQYKHPPS